MATKLTARQKAIEELKRKRKPASPKRTAGQVAGQVAKKAAKVVKTGVKNIGKAAATVAKNSKTGKSLKGAGRSAVVGGITGAGQGARAAKLKNRRGAVGEGGIAPGLSRVKGIGSVVPKGVKVTKRKTAKKKLKK